MVFLKEEKILIKSLRELNCYGSTRFLRECSTKNWTRRGLVNLLAIIDRTGIDWSCGGEWSSSTRHRHFPGARDARLHIFNTVATEFAGPQTSRLQHLECAAGEGLPLQDNWVTSRNSKHVWSTSGCNLTSRSLVPLSASSTVVYALVSVHAGHISSMNYDNVEPICRGTNCSV